MDLNGSCVSVCEREIRNFPLQELLDDFKSQDAVLSQDMPYSAEKRPLLDYGHPLYY